VAPFVRPVTVAVVAGGEPVTVVTVCAVVPMYGVIVYFVIGLPPLAGALHVTVALPIPGEAVGAAGSPGAVGAEMVIAFDAVEGSPVPTALVAVTVKVYVEPVARPVIVALV
jgi:hypothetical protein